MFSKIVFVVFAVNFIFAGSAYEPFMPAVLAPALKCHEAGNSAMVAVLQAMQDRPETDVDKINLSCLLCKVVEPCMVDVIKASSPVPKLFQFFAALQYQLHVFLKKADLCLRISYDELKSIALESGIMEEDKLVNIENDDYTKCAGDAMKKCMISAVILLQHQVDPVINDLKYIECMENQAKTCTVPIMEHFMGQLEVYKKHLKELMGK